ncbi:hypothetical protein INR49_028512 [Caranx melampygus]|nr:hypothetical protein INR49_028512 [Caranx melampygus]
MRKIVFDAFLCLLDPLGCNQGVIEGSYYVRAEMMAKPPAADWLVLGMEGAKQPGMTSCGQAHRSVSPDPLGWRNVCTHGRASADKPQECPESIVNENKMRLPFRWTAHRRVFVAAVVLGLLVLVMVFLPLNETGTHKPLHWHVNPAHKKLVHEHVLRVLNSQCRPGGARRSFLARLPTSGNVALPFLRKDVPLPVDLFLYPPPFGFRGLQGKVEDLLKLSSDKCQRCVVMGNGGILRGLELGPLIDRFDTIIRLNSGPLGEFSIDVGNRTSIRMSYPEGTPLHWVDTDPHTLFVAVVYKV